MLKHHLVPANAVAALGTRGLKNPDKTLRFLIEFNEVLGFCSVVFTSTFLIDPSELGISLLIYASLLPNDTSGSGD